MTKLRKIAMSMLGFAAMAMTTAAAAAPVASEISAPGPVGPLAGTFLAAGPADAPVVLILPGSGPTDRDGNNRFGVAANSYRLVAEALAVKGLSSARIDKRGLLGSKGAVADPNKVTLSDYAADVASWVKVLKDKTRQRCIWVAGHSEGGTIALAAASDPDICGLILISTPGRGYDTLIHEQLAANPANAPIMADVDAALAALARGEHVDVSGMAPALAKGLFNPAVQDYLIDLIRHRPSAMIAAVTKPVLIAGGLSDLQVPKADADALAAAQPAAKIVLIAGMTHTLKHVDGSDGVANMATYTNPELPVEPRLIDAIAEFIHAPVTKG